MVCKTLAKRGKSPTLESRIEILDERRLLLERRDETQEARASAIAYFQAHAAAKTENGK